MSSQLKEIPIEGSLFDVLNEVQDFKTHCLRCHKVPHSIIDVYIKNTVTRAKFIISCSDHVQSHLFLLCRLMQDPSRRREVVSLDNVTPEHSDNTSHAVYSFPIYIKGKCDRVLLATNNVIDPMTAASLLKAKFSVQDVDLPEESPSKVAYDESALSPVNERVVDRLYERPLDKKDILKAGEPDSASVLARGIAHMEAAHQALEHACEELQRLEGSRFSLRVSKSIHQRAVTLHASVKAISKFAEENTAHKRGAGEKEEEGLQKFCAEDNSFIRGEAVKYMEEDPSEVLRLDEKAEIVKTIEWFDMMEPKPPQ